MVTIPPSLQPPPKPPTIASTRSPSIPKQNQQEEQQAQEDYQQQVKEYEAKLSEYQAAQKEASEWEYVNKLWFGKQTGVEKYARAWGMEKYYGPPSIRDKINKMELGQASLEYAQQRARAANLAQDISTPPEYTYTDQYGQGVSSISPTSSLSLSPQQTAAKNLFGSIGYNPSIFESQGYLPTYTELNSPAGLGPTQLKVSQPTPPRVTQELSPTQGEVQPASLSIFDRGKFLLQNIKTKVQTKVPATREWSGSLTQEYFELTGTEFYKPEERQQIIQKRLQPLFSAETYEEQEQAIKDLKSQGIEIKEEKGEYVISESQLQEIAPTSYWGNALVGLTDALFKGAIFAEYFQTAAAKKGKSKSKTKQEVVYKRKFESEDDAGEKALAILKNIERKYMTGGKEAAEEEIIRISKQITDSSGREGFFKFLDELRKRGVINDFFYNTKTGELNFISPKKLSLFNIGEETQVTKLTGAGELTGVTAKVTQESSVEEDAIELLTGSRSKSASKLKISELEEEGQSESTIFSPKLSSTQSLFQPQLPKQTQPQLKSPIFNQPQLETPKLETPQRQLPRPRYPTIPVTRFPERTIQKKPGTPKPFPFWFPGEKDYISRELVGYNILVKEKKKWKQVSDNPLTREGAKDMGARYVDNTVAASFKIEPIMMTRTIRGEKEKVPKVFKENELKKGDGYFNQVVNKLRDHVIKKGKPFKVSNLWIEKKGSRIDTSGEKRGLSIARYKAELRKPKKQKTSRRRKFTI